MPITDPAPEVREELGVDAITYGVDGDVVLAGRGQRDVDLEVYLDDRLVERAKVDRDGAWSLGLKDVPAGLYTLRVDAVTSGRTVAARVETPFQRTAPEIAAASRRDGITAITVQPGFTLWAISEGYFGNGIQYVQIFEQNRHHIRNPDLIYPGQVFDLPIVD